MVDEVTVKEANRSGSKGWLFPQPVAGWVFPTWNMDVLQQLVPEVTARLRRSRLIQQGLVLFSVLCIAGVGVVMAAMMWIATLDDEEDELDDNNFKDAPDMRLAAILLAGMVIATIFWGFALRTEQMAMRLRGSLEYTTIMIMHLKNGRKYKYTRLLKHQGEETLEDKMRREVHQLRVESGLVGWSEEALQEQLLQIKDAYLAHDQRAVSGGDVAAPNLEVARTEARKVFVMVKNTVGAMPLIVAFVNVVFAIATVGIGAMGAFLTIRIVSMPDPDTDYLWIEYSWQSINVIFSLLAVYKGPGRIRLAYHILRHDWEEEIDGTVRSLVMPGVLLTRTQVIIITSLRMTNIVCQYVVSFFMWAWLPRCLQEERELKAECKTRPAWGVPVFLVLGMLTDIVANATLSAFIKKCDYIKWPHDGSGPEEPTLAKAQDGHDFGMTPQGPSAQALQDAIRETQGKPATQRVQNDNGASATRANGSPNGAVVPPVFGNRRE